MKPYILIGLTVILVLTAGLPATNAIVDLNDPRITRLWIETRDGRSFVCSATYIFPRVPDYTREDSGQLVPLAYVLTAGHCTIATLVARSADNAILGAVRWVAQITADSRFNANTWDIAIGRVPETRDSADIQFRWITDTMPLSGSVWIQGFPRGVEKVVPGYIIGKSDKYPGSLEVSVPPLSITKGSSGSAVLDEQGYVVGVLWGCNYNEEIGFCVDRVYVTPIEAARALLNLLEFRTQ